MIEKEAAGKERPRPLSRSRLGWGGVGWGGRGSDQSVQVGDFACKRNPGVF